MTNSLFRKEVIIARQNEWLGTIRLKPPRPGWLFLCIGSLCIASILALLIGGHYTRHEQISGMLMPSHGLLTLTASTSGIITHTLINEGEKVHYGQPLIEISAEQDSTTYGGTHKAIAIQLKLKRHRLQAALDEQQQLKSLQRGNLKHQLELAKEQITQTNQQISIQQQRSDSSMALYEQWAKLGKTGVISKLQLLQQHDLALQNLSQLKELRGQHFQLQQHVVQLQGQLSQLPIMAADKLRKTEYQLNDVTRSMIQNAAKRTIVVRAPIDGTITNLVVHQGQSIAAQEYLASVLPTKSKLIAELWAPTSAIGFIRKNEHVLIHYQAFPYQKFGQYLGRVQQVSKSAIPAAEVSRLIGEDIKDARYRVTVTLNRQNVIAYEKEESLKPGMKLTADVLLDKRSLIDWIFEPLFSFKHHVRTSTFTTPKNEAH